MPSRHRETSYNAIAPDGTPLHIAVAPGVPDQEQVVTREPGESDERYQSRCELFAVLLGYARRQD